MSPNQDEAISNEIAGGAARSRAKSSRVPLYYIQLHQLLRQGKWREADWETRRVMLSIAGADRRQECLLAETDIRSFPCGDLGILDCLWRGHTQGRFG